MLGLFNVWAIVAPLPALAPVIPPVIVPTVQVNVLGALAVNAMFVAVLLQIAAVFAVVTAGVGLTVTVIGYGDPVHDPAIEVGTTIYWSVPAVALLGFVNVCAIKLPEPPLPPVMLPVIGPTVQVNVLGVLDARLMFVAVPLQIVAVGGVVIAGVGFTVTVAVIV